jgi:hypothetical protein
MGLTRPPETRNHKLTLCLEKVNIVIASAISNMGQERTALLIRCSLEEAGQIRDGAHRQRRSVSGYVLNILDRALHVEELIFGGHQYRPSLKQRLGRIPKVAPRTVIFVRCSDYEASRIRAAARRRDITISGFVLHALRRAWNVANNPPGVRSQN